MTLLKCPGRRAATPILSLPAKHSRKRGLGLALTLATATVSGYAVADEVETPSVTVGPGAIAEGFSAIAIGDGANASADHAIAIGVRALASGDMSLATGLAAGAEADHAVALGGFARATANDSVAIGFRSFADREQSVSVGRAGAERQIVHVAAGTADTDAVNMSQLRATGLFDGDGNAMDAVSYDAGSRRGLVTFAGYGGTRLSNVMDGLIAPGSRDAVNGGQLWDVQKRIDSLGDRVNHLEHPQTLKPALGPTDGAQLIVKDETDTSDNASNGGTTTTNGVDAATTNNATVSPASVPVHQAPATTSVTPGTDTARWDRMRNELADVKSWAKDKFDGMSRKMDENRRQANRGIAASAALIDNMPYLPGKTTLNTGVASYRGESAFGLGVSRWSENGRININAGISAAAGDRPIFRMGLGVVLGD